MSDGTLLRVRGIGKSFPGVRALHDVDLALDHGEVLGLVGENGAGKSTLMKLLAGTYAPDSGTIEVDGRPVRIAGPRHARDLGISIIHQEFNLMPDLTVAQNIFIGREPRVAGWLSESALNRRAGELLERLGIRLEPRARVRDLSVAGQQMTEIAKALSVDARVLILDEPTAALNDAEVDALLTIIGDFVGPRTGAIYISHRMEELQRITDRITVLRDGGLVGSVPTAGTRLDDVITMMVGRELDLAPREPEPERTGTPALELVNVSTRHIRDVSLAVRPGEIVALAGLMGAGRTEVARAIVGVDKITAGGLLRSGRPVRIPDPAAAARLGVGYLSEDRKRYGLLLESSVTANIDIGSLPRMSRLGWVRDKLAAAAAADWVERLRVRTPSVRQIVRNLSGGNQQKVIIARWLLKDSDVLIFDEPTRGIDVGAKEEIHRLLDELARQGKAILVISSELPEVLRLAHRVVVMAQGRVAGELGQAEADQEQIMRLATRSEAELLADTTEVTQ